MSGSVPILVLHSDRDLPQAVPGARLRPGAVRHVLPVRDHRADRPAPGDVGHAGDQGSLHSPDQ